MFILKAKLLLIAITTLVVALFIIMPKNFSSILPVFQLTEKPNVISNGTYGKTITIDVTFGEEGMESFLNSLETPYPHFFLSNEWIERSPSLIQIMKNKNIPIGLLGQEGAAYMENPSLFKKEILRFEQSIGETPLWFRTKDYEFPAELQEVAWKHEVNLLSSSKQWMQSNPTPKLEKGDVLSVPLHIEEQIELKQLIQLLKSDSFLSIEENIFGLQTKTKTFPE